MSPTSEPSSQLHQRGVHLIADFQSKCGLSQSARDLVKLIDHLGIPHEILDLPLYPERNDEKKLLQENRPSYPLPSSSVSILSLNADFVSQVAETLPRAFFENRYIIGIWYWETEVLPPHHARGFDFVDEVWVASGHICKALQKISPVPIRQFTYVVHPPKSDGLGVLPPFLENDRFMFLFCYDYRSMAERKNPAGTAEAFIKAFPEPLPKGPLCVIKSVAGKPDNILEYLDLRHRFLHRPDIVFMDGYLPVDERDALMNRADCYVSLHRAEGLGLTLLESMSLGKPCITTAYSGNMDFSTPENSWLIPYRMVPVGPHKWPFEKEHLWAEPDLDAAADAMREAFTRPDILQAKGKQARITTIEKHNITACAVTIRSLLEDALKGTPRIKPGLAGDKTNLPGAKPSLGGELTGGPRAQAYSILKTAKEKHSRVRNLSKNLTGWRIPKDLRETLLSLIEVQKMQMEIHSRVLKELGQIKSGLGGLSTADIDRSLVDHQRCSRILEHVVERLAAPHTPAP